MTKLESCEKITKESVIYGIKHTRRFPRVIHKGKRCYKTTYVYP